MSGQFKIMLDIKKKVSSLSNKRGDVFGIYYPTWPRNASVFLRFYHPVTERPAAINVARAKDKIWPVRQLLEDEVAYLDLFTGDTRH